MSGTERIAVRAVDLAFSYPGRRRGHARSAFRLRCPRWEVRKGDRVALTGPSGCGKTTLLNLVAGVLSPDRGRLEVEGRELSAMTETQRRAHRIRNMGFVFQDFPLVDYLGAEENVLLPFRLNDALSLDRSARQQAGRLLDDLGISGRKRSRPDELSQGERQRVAIARALITEPSLLLADEPTAGLDPDRSTSVMELLERLSTERDLTLVMVTHDPAVIRRFDQVLDVAQLADAAEAGT